MVPEDLKLSLLYNEHATSEDAFGVQPIHIASWQSLEPSSSTSPDIRRVVLAYPDNTLWITSLLPVSKVDQSKPESDSSLPQLIIPSPSDESRSPTGTRLSRPSIPRSASLAGRHRASSSASSILSSSSRRRASALSPPPISAPLASISTTTASADPHLGHNHGNSDKPDLLEHLREQKGSGAVQDDGRLGLGLGGLGRRGLSGVHSKEDIAQQDGGAVSPKSAHSVDSGRTISTRLMGWMGDDKAAGDKERKELMERVQEVEVEREMLREVEEDRREAEEEKIIEGARRTPVGTPKLQSESGRTGGEIRAMRIVLRDSARGEIVQLRVAEEMGVLMVLRDIGILDIISLVTLDVVESLDLETPEVNSKLNLRLSPFWHWRGIHILQHAEEPLVILHGLPWPCALPSPNGEVTRVVMLRRARNGSLEIVSRLELPGEGDIGVTHNGSDNTILHSTPNSLTSYSITSPAHIIPALAPSAVQLRTSQPRSVSAANPSTSSPANQPNTSLLPPGESGQLRKAKSTVQLRDAADQPLPYPPEQKERERTLANFLAQRRGDKDTKPKVPDAVLGWGVGPGRDIQKEKAGGWDRMVVHSGGQGVGLGIEGVDVFRVDGDSLEIQQHIDLTSSGKTATTVDIFDNGNTMVLSNENCTVAYRKADVSADADSPRWEEIYRHNAKAAICSGGPGVILLAGKDGLNTLKHGDSETRRVIQFQQPGGKREIDIITPYNVDTCFVADFTGNIFKRKLSDVLSGAPTEASDSLTSDRLEARVTCMKVVHSDPKYMVAGDEDGVVRIWDAETFELQGSWTLFAFPVQTITLLSSPKFGSLNDSIMCTSQAGTVGLISLQEMEHLFLIPASRVPLRRVYIGGKDIMLAYANGKARVWNYETQEFRRSTGLDAAEDMLNSGEWTVIDIDVANEGSGAVSSAVSTTPVPSDLGRILQFDIRELCSFLQSGTANSPLGTLRTILYALIPFGVDPEIDRICTEELDINPPAGRISIGRSGQSGCTISQVSGGDIWRVSPQVTGTLQLAIVALLRMFLDSPDHERPAAQLIAYFTASLPMDCILAGLPFFAAFYLDPIADIHQAARMLFGCQMDAMRETEFEAVVDAHLPELPSFLPSSDQHLKAADLALTMLGGMALHKFQSMAPGALKAIAESVNLYLNSSITSHLSLAIELASKGFTTWQAFVDPADMLRRLFLLSTQSSSTPQGSQISAQARLAVLHVASSNPALFMSTLSMDILDARSVEGRKSIMKLCVYMARKKPEVLENSLPKVVEAVVKSLDPNLGKMRDDVQQTATVILNELVLAFSTIDFHSTTQKLAVGTHEGALIMYDLKTASRLYILEPHKHPVSAVNFSPDGRRLITVSLEEGGLTVWKIGSSLSGFFNVGGPPRQGGKAGEPFKRIEFARADNVPLDSTSALSDVQISWPGPRQAKVLIKETAMNFET